MAHQSLYRRYRPRRFGDVRGQAHVIRALRNAVREEQVGHAYLFTGPRGTGKTSTARILAKALNCENLKDGEPDGTCESCLAIDGGTSYDVQELDAASNNGVSDVRDLIARVNLGSPGRTKVYILDEVHMLTAQASAALLKTLEEPPGHVVFVLATTDPQKVLPTIKSRTQQYDFHLLSAEELAEHVRWVIHDAELGLEDDAVDHVVRLGAGSARDTLSALDQVAAAGGVLDREDSLGDLLDAVAAGDAPKALVAVASAVSAGRDPRVLGEALLARLRDVFLVRMGAPTEHLPPGDVDVVRAWADQLGDRATTRALEAVGEALLEMRQAPDPRIPLEVALVSITRPDDGADVAALADRVARLEARVAQGVPASQAAAPAPAASAAPAPAPRAAAAADAPPTERPAPPPVPGGQRPAGAARAREALAASRGEPTPPGAPAARSAPAPTPPPAAPGPPAGRRAPQPPGGPAPARPAPTPPPAPEASPTPAPANAPASVDAAPAQAGGSAPADLAALEDAWANTVIPSLGGMTKAMFNVGRFRSFDGRTATLALPNEVHRQKCEQKRGEVEAQLRTVVAGVTLELIVDDGEGGGSGGRGPGPEPEPERDDDFDLDGTDIHDLDDAPDAPAAGIEALTEAFPGSELIEGT